jgi:hypothetical protein
VVSRLSMLHSESVLARGGLPLFTELPRRVVFSEICIHPFARIRGGRNMTEEECGEGLFWTQATEAQ